MDIKASAKYMLPEIVNWRRDLHKIPEIGFDLRETSLYIRNQLDLMKIPYYISAYTGVIGLIEGAKSGPTIALRADMDALPILEETGLEFASNNGNMHACGHDAHMAMLLGAARIITKMRSHINGNVKLIFQPGEEGYGGASLMVEGGCLDNPKVDVIAGLHVGQIYSELSSGQIGFSKGVMFAASNYFSIIVSRNGDYGTLHDQNVDVIAVASELILSIQKIISREVNPLHHVVLTIGKIHSEEASYAGDSVVVIKGEFRTLNKSERDFLSTRLKELCIFSAKANKAVIEINITQGYPITVNDPWFACKVRDAARKIYSVENIIQIKKPNMASDDMSFYLEKIPGAYFVIDTSNPQKGIIYPDHNSKFDVDEDLLWVGPAIFSQLAIDFLGISG